MSVPEHIHDLAHTVKQTRCCVCGASNVQTTLYAQCYGWDRRWYCKYCWDRRLLGLGPCTPKLPSPIEPLAFLTASPLSVWADK